jgi:hypothetical protein
MRRMNIPNGYKCLMGEVGRGGTSEAWSHGFEPPRSCEVCISKGIIASSTVQIHSSDWGSCWPAVKAPSQCWIESCMNRHWQWEYHHCQARPQPNSDMLILGRGLIRQRQHNITTGLNHDQQCYVVESTYPWLLGSPPSDLAIPIASGYK